MKINKQNILKLFFYPPQKILNFVIILLEKLWSLYLPLRRHQTEVFIPVEASGSLPVDTDEVLKNCSNELEKNNTPYFLSWGNALGLYRDGKFIAHDSDIDFDIVDYYDFDKIDEAMEQADLQLAQQITYKKQIQQLVYLSQSGVIIDVVFWRKKDEMLVTYCEPGYVLKLPSKLMRKPTYINYQGKLYPISSNPEEYLLTLYGPDWRTPAKSKGDWKDDCKIIHEMPDPIMRLYKKIYPLYCKYIKNLL